MKRLSFSLGIVILTLVAQLQRTNAQTVKEKADVLIAAGSKHLTRPDSLNYYADRLMELSRAEHYTTGEGWALKFKGIAQNAAANYQDAINWYRQGLKIFTDLGNELEIAKAHLNLAGGYQKLSNHAAALEHGEKALYLFENLKDRNGIGRVLNILGITLMAQKNYNEARNYFIRYNNYAVQTNVPAEIANSYNGLGSVYSKLGMPDSSIYFLTKAAAANQKLENKLAIAHNYLNIGVTYHENVKDDAKALAYYRRAQALYSELNNRKFLSEALLDIGQAYKNLRDTVKARKYINDAIKMASQASEKQVIAEAHKTLAEMNEKENNYKDAYINFQNSVKARDSIQGVKMLTRMQNLQVKYDTYKKQQQIRELTREAELHRLQIRQRNLYLSIGCILVLLGIIVVAFLSDKRKLQERARREREKSQLQELMTRETLNAEERERRRIGHDLHDGVGQLLSAALLNLNSLSDKLSTSAEKRDLAGKSIALVSQSYDEIRTISHQIIPNALLKAGLASAVKEFINLIDSDKLKVNLEISGLSTKPEDDQTETVLYRVIQETVTNVIKHSGANLLSIQLFKDEDGISLTIEDNGKGFDPAKEFKGTGLRNIQHRIALLNGTVEFDAKAGRGTLVAIHVPA